MKAVHTLFVFIFFSLNSQADSSCAGRILNIIKTSDPRSYQVYQTLTDKDVFYRHLNCSEANGDAYTAIHESTHIIDYGATSYHLDSGKKIPMAKDISLPPSQIYSEVSDNMYASTYLTGGVTASDGISGLLAELNAYSRELITASRTKALNPHPDRSVSMRDGVASMMLFLKVYLNRVESAGRLHEITNSAKTMQAIRELWKQAEFALSATCRNPSLGIEDANVLRKVYSSNQMGALTQMIGSTPSLPLECGGKKSVPRVLPKQKFQGRLVPAAGQK